MLLWSSLAWAGITEEEAVQEVLRIQLEAGERVLVGRRGAVGGPEPGWLKGKNSAKLRVLALERTALMERS